MVQSTLEPPRDCGRRIIPKLIDDIAYSDPQRPFVSVPRSSQLENGFEDISYDRFARAVNRCSWWMEEHLGTERKLETLAYLGPLDVRYLIVLLAASKTGRVAFLSSHRNSLEAHLTLLEQTQCRTILVAKQAPVVTKKILEERPMLELSMPGFEYFDNDEHVEIYPWQGTFDEVRDKPFVILHTSGSTGFPKPVYVTHGTFAGNDAHQLIPSLGGKPTFGDYIRGKRYFLALPMFHSANLTFTMGFNVFFGVTCILPPPVPMTADILNKVHTFGNVHGSLLPPSLVIDVYNNPEYLANMIQRLQFVTYVGGTLPKEIGDPISSKMKLITLFGSTETKLFPIEVDDDSTDWEYIPISRFLGHEFRPSRDKLFELVIVRKEDLCLFQGVFSTFPDLQEYPMKDLYKQNPRSGGSWAFRARADDIIALNNAEKLNPVTMETIISGHPSVKSAIIGGHGQFQAALLVEPNQPLLDDKERLKFILDIWPTVMQANRDCPAHGRIMKDFIMVTSPDKPLPRAGKDTVQRYAAIKLYAEEFKALYSSKSEKPQREPMNGTVELSSACKAEALTGGTDTRGEQAEPPNEPAGMLVAELDARIEAVLHRVLPGALLQHLGPAMVQMITNLPLAPASQTNSQYGAKDYCDSAQNVATKHMPSALGTIGAIQSQPQDLRQGIYRAIGESTYLYNLNDEANLFECGLDSLQVTALVGEINAFLEGFRPDVSRISNKTIYDNLNIERLLAAMEGSSHGMKA